MHRRHISVLAPISALVALSIGLSACGGGSSETTPAPSQSTAATVRPSSTTAQAATPSPAARATTATYTVQTSDNATLGETILVNAQGMTLYTYAKDSAGTSNCTGTCATAWPPLTAGGGAPSAGAGVTGTLATISRADGAKQVTYGGMPLYTFQQDVAPGDATGDGVNSFHVATP